MRTVSITLSDPDEMGEPTRWEMMRAILEAYEPGSSSHCLAFQDEPGLSRCTHVRLGLVIEVRS